MWQERPGADGFYWYQVNECLIPAMVWVCTRSHIRADGDPNDRFCCFFGNNKEYPLDEVKGRWWGPIPHPPLER